jgi:hypothetical protein
MPALNIEHFPDWSSRPHRAAETKVDRVTLGSEYDISHVFRLWQRVMRYNIQDLPEDESVMWQLVDKLGGRRSDIVLIHDGIVSIDRCHMGDFRDGLDWLLDHLCDEHGDHRYAWFRDVGDWVRVETAAPPITDLEDARRAIEIIDCLTELAADNVVKL